MQSTCYYCNQLSWKRCLIMQHKPYIVEQLPMCPFKSYHHCTKVCKLVQEYKATRQMTGIWSIQFEVRLKFCPKCDIDTCTCNPVYQGRHPICLVQTLTIWPAQLSSFGGSAGRAVCLECRTSQVRVPPKATLLFLLEKWSCLQVSLLAFAL